MEIVKALAAKAAAAKIIYGPESPEAREARNALNLARFAGFRA